MKGTASPSSRSVGSRWLIPLLSLFLLLPGSGASAAGYDPALRWRTLRTPHFNIHYAEGLEADAREIARVAENVHAPMVQVLGWEPREPTEVTLVDRTDLANGYTTVLPYNQVVLYTARPGSFEFIGAYDGWLETLFVHEYAHVLGIDPVRGYAAVFRKVFGRVYVPLTPVGAFFWFFAAPPNLFLPPWLHEGLAVNMETDMTSGGRKGSTLYDMIYRVDVASGTVPSLDRLGGDFPGWPSLRTRYIYGARLLELVEKEYGRGALGRIFVGHSGRFPFAIDSPPARATGSDYVGLYRRMRAELESTYRPVIRRLEEEGLTPVQAETYSGYLNAAPLWIGADSLVYTRSNNIHPAVLVRKDLGRDEEEILAERPGLPSRATRLPEARVAYTRVEVSRPAAGGLLYSDLYSCDATGGAVRRLTHGARILEADYSPVARAYVAVQSRGSGQRLVRVTEGEGEPRIDILLAEDGVRYDGPRWSPDGKWIAFSRKPDRGHARLAILEAAGSKIRLLTPDGADAGFPAWSPEGRRLAFAWDRSGIFDLYAFDLGSGTCMRLTRVLGGAFHPDWSADGRRIAFSSYSSRGFDIAVLDLANALGEPVVPLPLPQATEPEPSSPPPPSIVESAPYSPWPRVLPTFWLPDLIGDNAGVAPGLWTAGQDPLYRHLYYATGFWGVSSHRFYGQGVYINDVSYPTVTVRAAKLPVAYSDLLEAPGEDYDYWEEDRTLGVELRLGLPRALRQWSFAVSWAWEEVARLSRVGEDLDGRQDLADLPFQGKTNPLALSILYDSAFPYDNRFTVGAEDGRRLEATYRLRHESLGSDLNLQEWLGEWREYVPLFGLPHTVMAFRAKGGAGRGEIPLQSVFQLGGSAGEFPLRGYAARAVRGERAALGSAEVRFPLFSPYRGIRDLPLFFGRLHTAAFFDAGRVWKGSDDEWRKSAGLELRADTLLGYYFPTTLVVGYAHGFDDDGRNEVYLTFANVY